MMRAHIFIYQGWCFKKSKIQQFVKKNITLNINVRGNIQIPIEDVVVNIFVSPFRTKLPTSEQLEVSWKLL